MYPNFNEEKKLWSLGHKFVVGLDEVGRGPLAGPVVAAAVHINPLEYKVLDLRGLDDSKKLSEKQRSFFYDKLTQNKTVQWGVGIVAEKVIDKVNIFEATKLAMIKALKALKVVPDFLLLDGNFTIPHTTLQKPIIKGDQKVFSIAAASIIAKVTRDRIMHQMHQKYPMYGFDQHKGYGTAQHIQNLETFGPCKIHRRSFL